MKLKKTYLFITMLFVQSIIAQDTITTFYDFNWKEIKNIESAAYYRKFFKSDEIYVANDYYKNGNIQMIGTYSNKKGTLREGFFKYFHENGNIKSEGNYLKNQQTGNWKIYSDDGKLDSEGEYIKGKKNGIWIWYTENGNICSKEVYKKDERTSYTFFDEKGNDVNISDAEFLAKFNDGDANDFTKWVFKNIKHLNENGDVHGRLLIEFIVNKVGEIEDIKVLSSVSLLIDSEVIKVIKSSPKWSPAKMHNKYVKVRYVIPISFNR